MTLAFDFPQCSASPLGRVDARWKLAALVIAAAVAALERTLLPSLLSLMLALALAVVGRLPARWYLRRLSAVLGLLVVFALWLPFLVPGDGWDIGAWHMSQPGLILGCLVAVKACTIVSLMLVLWATAPVHDTLKAAHALRVPGLIVQLLVLSQRYIHLLAEELRRLRIALRVRGYRHRPNMHSYRTVGHVTGSLLIRSYERAERVGQAMRCRAFDGRFRSLTSFRTRPLDLLVFLAIVLSSAALLLWDRLLW
jgi:cobalt/nickel transport system permease protein